MKKNYYALMFFCEDKPGIVANVSKILFEKGLNIEDSSSTLLRGFFSMILLVSSKDEVDTNNLLNEFNELAGIKTSIKKIEQLSKKNLEDTYIISVYGGDKPGLVYAISNALANKKINIIDLQTKVAGKEGSPVYIMVFEVTVPDNIKNEDWINELTSISKEMGTDINIRHIETYEF
jgi:glycine cleavage system transcriptional repressor